MMVADMGPTYAREGGAPSGDSTVPVSESY